MSKFTSQQVQDVSNYLQNYMQKNNILSLSADECANILASNNILTNKVGPKLGFNFRQMLRDGRDGHIMLVTGAFQQRPHTKWVIYKGT